MILIDSNLNVHTIFMSQNPEFNTANDYAEVAEPGQRRRLQEPIL